jgi:hypothetical protein
MRNLENCVDVKDVTVEQAAESMKMLSRMVGKRVGHGIWEGTVAGTLSGNTYKGEHVAVFSNYSLIAPFGPRGDRESEACAALFVLACEYAEKFVSSLRSRVRTMRKQIIIVFGVLGLAFRAMATMSVIDHAHIAQDAANEVVNLVRYVQTATKETETALNTLRTYENTVLQVARMGDPAALRNIPGLSTVAELYQLYGQLSRDYVTAQALLNPQRYEADMNYILRSYQLPQWNGYTASNGLPVLPAQGLFQFPTASWNVANNAQQELKTLDDQRQRLQRQRDEALRSLQNATTQSDVQKYHAVIDSLNAAIAEVAHGEQELYHRTGYQNQQLQAGQQIYLQCEPGRATASRRSFAVRSRYHVL